MRRPARVLVSWQVAVPRSDREFLASTEGSGTQRHAACGRAPRLTPRRPGPSSSRRYIKIRCRPVGLLLVAVSIRVVADPNRISSSGHSCPDRFKLDQPSRPVSSGWCRTVVNCNPNGNPQIRRSGRVVQDCPLRSMSWADSPDRSIRGICSRPSWQQVWQ